MFDFALNLSGLGTLRKVLGHLINIQADKCFICDILEEVFIKYSTKDMDF